MPEILEVEQARALIEARGLGREIAAVEAPDAWFLKRGLSASAARTALTGRALVRARRRGKQLLLDSGPPVASGSGRRGSEPGGPVLGLHLGMSGRILIDGQAAGDPLVYASNRDVAEWERFGLRFADGGRLTLRDPRRLGGVELDPVEDRLGIDAPELRLADLRQVLRGRAAPVKAVLMDQSRIAGLGNLLTDEALWRAGVDPARPAGELEPEVVVRLHRAVGTTLRVLGRRGGSHTGDLMAARVPGGLCPRDGAMLVRRQVGGRTTFSCPRHQR